MLDRISYIFWNIVLFVSVLLEGINRIITKQSIFIFYIFLILKLMGYLDIHWLFVFTPLIIFIFVNTLQETLDLKDSITEEKENEEENENNE